MNEAAVQRAHWEQDHAGRRSPSHPAVRALFEPRAAFVFDLLGRDCAATVLDAGCGNGFLTAPLEARFARAVGLDYSESMLRLNPAREKIHAEVTALPYPDASFDAVVMSHVLHHMPTAERTAAVRELVRVARRAVVIWEPNRNHPLMAAFSLLNPHERLLLRFSPDEPAALLRGAGIANITRRNEGLITPNLCPAALAGLARTLGGTPLRAAGMYVRTVARREGTTAGATR